MQGQITVLEGDDLVTFLQQFGIEKPSDALVYKVRLWQAPDHTHVKVKVNEGIWTWELGTKDGAA